jgi:hypothetical protein
LGNDSKKSIDYDYGNEQIDYSLSNFLQKINRLVTPFLQGILQSSIKKQCKFILMKLVNQIRHFLSVLSSTTRPTCPTLFFRELNLTTFNLIWAADYFCLLGFFPARQVSEKILKESSKNTENALHGVASERDHKVFFDFFLILSFVFKTIFGTSCSSLIDRIRNVWKFPSPFSMNTLIPCSNKFKNCNKQFLSSI